MEQQHPLLPTQQFTLRIEEEQFNGWKLVCTIRVEENKILIDRITFRINFNYLNKDFTEYRAQLINYAQSYFPTTYTDFSETSPGMMFIEQVAYVGDVLSFYLDNQIQENYVQYARQDNNLYQMAYMFGYKPTVTTLATTEVDFYQLVPSKLSGSEYIPDYDYALYVNANTTTSTRTGTPTTFTIEDPIDFSVSSSDIFSASPLLAATPFCKAEKRPKL